MSTAPSFGIGPGIGKTVLVKGNLLSGEDLTIDGEVEGTIEVLEHRLTIAATGRVRADVNARDIEIWGCLEGKLEAVNRVHMRSVVCASICLRIDSTDALDRRKRLASALSSRSSPSSRCSVSIHGLPNWLASSRATKITRRAFSV